MAQLILDTSVLIRHWNDSRGGRPFNQLAEQDTARWADQLIDIRQTNWIVTPVYVEMVAGVRSKQELRLAWAYLERFEVIDENVIPADDWRDATRIAQRVPRDGKPRQLGDCIIRAIANRLNCDVVSFDDSFPG